jgi:hypothetical protein
VFVIADVFIRSFNDNRAKQQSQIKNKIWTHLCEALISITSVPGGIAFAVVRV